MSHLAYIPPFINQNNDQQPGGPPDVNARMNCVAASIAWADESLTHATYYAEQVKDAVYGNAYVGMTSEQSYVTWEQGQGVKLWNFSSSSPTALIAAIHSFLAQGFPVLITMPSEWGIPLSQQPAGFTTHVGCAFSDDGGGIHVMNPWGGFDHYGSDQYWADRLCYGTVWPMSRTGEIPMGVPANWKDDGTTLTAPNGQVVTLGFRDHILGTTWESDDWPLENAVGLKSVELGNSSIGAGTRQIFRKHMLGWTPTRAVYEAWTGQELLAWIDQANTLQAQLTSATETIANLQANVDAMTSKLQAVQADEATDEATIATLKAQQSSSVDHSIAVDVENLSKLLGTVSNS